MKYEQIISLLEKGLTPAEITQLNALPDVPAEEPAPAPAPEIPEQPNQTVVIENPVPEWATSLQQSIERMTNALHANAILQQQQPEMPVMTAEQALASVLEPPKKG